MKLDPGALIENSKILQRVSNMLQFGTPGENRENPFGVQVPDKTQAPSGSGRHPLPATGAQARPPPLPGGYPERVTLTGRPSGETS